jgi:hypothetical protein
MRLIFTAILALSVGAIGCSGAATSTTENALATTSTAAAHTNGAPATAASRADAAHPAAGVEARASAAVPEIREVTIPAGTSLPVVLETGVASDTSRVEDTVTGHLSRSITIDGMTALPEGSRVSGVVTEATRSAKVKGLAHVAVRFDSVTPRGDDQRYKIQTASVGRTAASTKKDDALKIGAPAAGGAIIGAIVGGGKGAAIGTAVGGGAGTGVVLATRGKEVAMPKGAALTLRLSQPLTVRIAG